MLETALRLSVVQHFGRVLPLFASAASQREAEYGKAVIELKVLLKQ